MRNTYLLGSVGVLIACLATWAALHGAQPEKAATPPNLPAGGSPRSLIPPPPSMSETAPPSPGHLPKGPKELTVPHQSPPGGPEVIEPPTKGELSPVASTPLVPPPVGVTAGKASGPEAPSATEINTPASMAARPAFDEKPDMSATAENPTGRQEPAVSLEWVGTSAAKVGQPADYSVVVRNTCNVPVQQVMVRVRVPAGMTLMTSEPKATPDGGVLVWELGTLMAKQEKLVQLKMRADVKGEVTPQAWVTFTGSSVMRIRVREPKLLIKASAPDKVLVGDPAAFTLTVSNPGDGSADQVKIHAVLSEGLQHARGNRIDFDIGNLAPGESRNVTLLCATQTGGAQKCEVAAEADGGLKAQDVAPVNVIMPSLNLAVEGPGLRYLDRKALYVLKITNPGDAPATNVTVADVVPAGFKVLAASDGGRHDFQTRTVSWFLGEIGPGQTREVKLEVQAVNAGEHRHKATAVGARGLRAESEKLTRIEGLAALMVEVVDTEDPIEVGGNTAYEVRITNTGSKTETDIKLVATIPDKMQFAGAQGPVRYHEEGKTIVFEPLDKLAPRADAVFRINVKALEASTVRFKIQVTSANLTEPVVKMEATRIYSDALDTPGTPAPPSMPATVSSPLPAPSMRTPAAGPPPSPSLPVTPPLK